MINSNVKTGRYSNFLDQTIQKSDYPIVNNPVEMKKFFSTDLVAYRLTANIADFLRDIVVYYKNDSIFLDNCIVCYPNIKEQKTAAVLISNNTSQNLGLDFEHFLHGVQNSRRDISVDNREKNLYLFSGTSEIYKLGISCFLNFHSKGNPESITFIDILSRFEHFSNAYFGEKCRNIFMNFSLNSVVNLIDNMQTSDVGKKYSDYFLQFIENYNPVEYVNPIEYMLITDSYHGCKTINDMCVMAAMYLLFIYCAKPLEEQMSDRQKQYIKSFLTTKAEKRTIVPDAEGFNEAIPMENSDNESEARKKEIVLSESLDIIKTLTEINFNRESQLNDVLSERSVNWGSETGVENYKEISLKKFSQNDTLLKHASPYSETIRGQSVINKRKIYKYVNTGIIPKRRKLEHLKECSILVDTSGSVHHMCDRFLQLIWHPDVKTNLYYFDTQLLVVKNNEIKTKNDLLRLTRSIPLGGGTDLNQPLKELFNVNDKKYPKTIIVFTDGEMPPVNLDDVISKIIVYTVGREIKFLNAEKCKIIQILVNIDMFGNLRERIKK